MKLNVRLTNGDMYAVKVRDSLDGLTAYRLRKHIEDCPECRKLMEKRHVRRNPVR